MPVSALNSHSASSSLARAMSEEEEQHPAHCPSPAPLFGDPSKSRGGTGVASASPMGVGVPGKRWSGSHEGAHPQTEDMSSRGSTEPQQVLPSCQDPAWLCLLPAVRVTRLCVPLTQQQELSQCLCCNGEACNLLLKV